MDAIDAKQWWVPHKQVAGYLFGSNISEIPGFHILNVTATDVRPDDCEYYVSIDQNFEIIVKDQILQSLRCTKLFIAKTANVIGEDILVLAKNLHERFGTNELEMERGEFVIYDNGDVERDIDVRSLSIFATVREDGIIQSISAYY